MSTLGTVVPTDPRSARWGHPELPEWVEGFRQPQLDAIEAIAEHYRAGVEVVLLEAPTGTGKTLLAEAVRRLGGFGKTLYVCTTKDLQRQFLGDFPYAKVLMGRANYPTLDFPERATDRFMAVTAADCTLAREEVPACSGCPDDYTASAVLHCLHCHPWHACPYQVAKREAFRAPLAVTNTAYFLVEANGPGQFSNRDLTIVDECDTLESVLMGQVEVVVGERLRKQYDIDFPARKTVAAAWREWLHHEATPKLSKALGDLHTKLGGRAPDPAQVKEMNRLTRLLGRLAVMAQEMDDPEGLGWVYDSKAQDAGHIVFRPVRVDTLGPDWVWRHSRRWLAMSATIIDPTEYTESLGLTRPWAMVSVPCSFPVDNRRVHVLPVANMTFKEREAEWPKMAEAVARVLRKHPTERTLVHTVSYGLAQYLFDRLRREFPRRLLVYSSPKEREMVLTRFKEMDAAVVLAPSWDRGVDLPGDLCRVQVVAKVPFPNTGDPQVNARLYSRGGRSWYNVQTVRSLVQMTGRAVRSETDWATTYILDAQFLRNVYSNARVLLPRWWKEGLCFDGGCL